MTQHRPHPVAPSHSPSEIDSRFDTRGPVRRRLRSARLPTPPAIVATRHRCGLVFDLDAGSAQRLCGSSDSLAWNTAGSDARAGSRSLHRVARLPGRVDAADNPPLSVASRFPRGAGHAPRIRQVAAADVTKVIRRRRSSSSLLISARSNASRNAPADARRILDARPAPTRRPPIGYTEIEVRPAPVATIK